MGPAPVNPYSEFTCLYTSQKQKKAKTWQDGHLRYFHNNSKVILYDTKFSVLDSMFHRGDTITVGDDMDMEKHLITIEELTIAYAANTTDQRIDFNPGPVATIEKSKTFTKASDVPILSSASRIETSASDTVRLLNSGLDPLSSTSKAQLMSVQQPSKNNQAAPDSLRQPEVKRRKWRPPVPTAVSSPNNTSHNDSDWGSVHRDQLQATSSSSIEPMPSPGPSNSNIPVKAALQAGVTATAITTSNTDITVPQPAPKRRKVGLSKSSPSTASGQFYTASPYRPPSKQLEFPTAARCTNFMGKNTSQLLRRSMTLGSRFASTTQYVDGMALLIYEHLQIMVIEIAITMWGLKSRATMRENEALDAFYRSRGIHMHADSHIRRRGDVYPGFPLYSDRTIKGIGETSTVNVATIPQTLSQQGVSLSISNKEHHSKYSKDDLWVVSTTPQFDATSTFFARSVFYGPSGNDIELMCLSSKDSSIARDICVNSTTVCAIKLFNAMSEFMMLDNLENSLTRTPLLPVLLNYVPPELVKASKTSVFKVPSRVPERSGCIVLTEEDGIDVEVEIQDAVERFRLNHEQAAVLRAFAQTVVRAPRWVQKPPDTPPILLVHGVYGAGKSFLIAVLIVFIDTIMNKARPLPKEQRSCRFLVSSMTNVAVDRVLIALLNLNYTKFVRVGSLKKVAKRILPFTAQSTSARAGEDIKELQAILDDDSLSASERRYVKEAMKKFQKFENRGLVEGANVVGTTCIASTFEVLDDVSFPIVILDEASQLLEAMSLIPICRAAAEKLILVGDPLQLPPPISTSEGTKDTIGVSKGLSRTLFDRSTEMGLKPIMLRTQYRCHRRIAQISNTLFYSSTLQTGASDEDRAPLIQGLPTLTFIDSPGQEVQNTKTKSFTNPAEVKLIVAFLRSLLSLNIPEASIGVISLYKSQADSIQAELNEQLKASGLKGGVQISTVDAFQGSEKDLIIVSTVRTGSIGFIDNDHRVNVALTRSKRHLFIVGNLQLLSSNRIWGPVIKGHCSVDMNGIMQGEQFAQRLRSLIPLPQQNILEPTAVIESEDDNENEAMGRHYDDYEDEDGLRHDQNEMDYDGYERSVEHFNERSVSSRIYTLYETDEDSDEESNDERNQPRDRRQMSGHNSTAPKSYIRSFAQTNVGDDDYIAVDPRSLSNLETAPDTATSSSSFEPKNSRKYVLGIFEEQNQAVPTESALQDRNILQSSGEARQMKHVSKNGFSRKARASLMVWPSMAKSLPSIINEHPQPAGYLEDQVLWEVGEEDEEKVECDERDDKMTNSRFKSIFNGNTPVENVVLSRRQSQERARSVDQFKQDWDIQEPLTYGSQRIEDLDVDWTQAESSGHSQKHIAHAASLPPRPVSEMKDRLYFDEGNGNEDEDDIGYLEISDADML